MDRGDIRIKRVPMQLAQYLVGELNHRIKLPDIYFARYSDPKRRWEIAPIKDDLGQTNEHFADLYLKFAPSASLKAITADAMLSDDVIHYDDLAELPKPEEQGFAPFATAPFIEDGFVRRPSRDRWFMRWPVMIKQYITHWTYNAQARKYATDDVVNTRSLYHFFDCPAFNDEDSILACQVGAIRWKGLKIDKAKIQELKDETQKKLDEVEFAYNSPKVCATYLSEVLSETERLVIQKGDGVSTKGVVLEELAKWKKSDVCPTCSGMGTVGSESCTKCKGTALIDTDEPHPVAARAQLLLNARHAKKEIELLDKLLLAGRFHVSYKVIGTLSGRMAGSDGLNPQGINRGARIRSCFPLAWDHLQLDGGDFDSFEVTIADAVWYDPRLREFQLQGIKIHSVFGTYLFPGHTHQEISATSKLDGEANLYSRSKQGIFAMLYGGEEYTLANRVGIDEEAASVAYREFSKDFPGLAIARKKVADKFCALVQPKGIGTRVEWVEPDDYIESLFGFRRYFTLENQICRALFDLAENPPEEWQKIKVKVMRRDREQTVCGAVRSALFASAFALCSANMRAAGNHVIQSTGSTVTKRLQCKIWEFQPHGVNTWQVMPCNFHDEIMCPTRPVLSDAVAKVVNEFIAEYKKHIPLLGMAWAQKMENWSKK
jgi:DNA polymerase I-like protein with 3'-5' exonuclease and polymerase domains